jgi:hypothetical protein
VGGNSFKYQGGMAVIIISLGGISVRNSFLGGIAVLCRYIFDAQESCASSQLLLYV